MNKALVISILAALLSICAAPALADSFGDMIAKNLCVSPLATLTLSDTDSATYDNSASISGEYNFETEHDIIGTKFTKKYSKASCEKSTKPKKAPSPGVTPVAVIVTWDIVKKGNTLQEDK